MIRAVILDLDDTLTLTEEACFYMENEVLATMGRSRMSREVHRANWGKPLFEAILERSPGIDVEAFRSVYEPIIKSYTNTGRLDAIPEENMRALDLLKHAGKALVILTSRELTEISHLLEPDHALQNYVETFYYKDNMQYHKPDPRAFEHIESLHRWKPSECVYVGDSLSDALAAKGAGLHFIASLESGLRTREDFQEYPVDIFIDQFPQVVEAVRQLDAA